MNLNADLERLKHEVCLFFNNQFGTSLKPVDLKALLRKPFPESVLNILFITNLPKDNARFRLVVKSFTNKTLITPFKFKLKRNSSPRTLFDEVQEASCELSRTSYPFLKTFSETQSFHSYVENTSQLKSKAGEKILTKSGFKLLSQR